MPPMPKIEELLFNDAVTNLAQLKQQQWATTNYALLLVAAVTATSQTASAVPKAVLIAALVSIASSSALLLTKLHLGGWSFRVRLRELLRKHIPEAERERYMLTDHKKTKWTGSLFPIVLTNVVIVGATVGCLVVLSEGPQVPSLSLQLR